MIEKLVVVGWVGVALLLAAGGSGYLLGEGHERMLLHLFLAVLASGAFVLAYLGLAIYLVGTARLVRRTVVEEKLDPSWVREHRCVWLPSLVVIVLAVVPLALAVASGFPTYTGALASTTHHLLFPVAAALQLLALGVLRQRVARGEARLKALEAAL
jgi:amino acid transporter